MSQTNLKLLSNKQLSKLSQKQLDDHLKQLRQDLKETWQQLRLGAITNVRRPTRIRRQIAQTLTYLRQSETADKPKSTSSTKTTAKKSIPTTSQKTKDKEGD